MVKKTPVEDLRVGDIILYRSNNQMICHRLVRKITCGSGYLLYTRGDASSNLGEPITEEALVGRVVGVLKNGRILIRSGRWYYFVNRFIVGFTPFLTLIRRWKSHLVQ